MAGVRGARPDRADVGTAPLVAGWGEARGGGAYNVKHIIRYSDAPEYRVI